MEDCKIILGCATFNTQYNDVPESLPVVEIMKKAFGDGINVIDTSPYYGPSEILVGEALAKIKPRRSTFQICTKAGRITENEFNYSPEHIRFSVKRSIERLLGWCPDETEKYLDLVYLHDVEFQTLNDITGAIKELMILKKEGFIKRVGISGYPVKFLYEVSKYCKESRDIGPLDCVLSYCNMNLQNNTLDMYYHRFKNDCGIRMISNASILSMSLLREEETRSFHPCSSELRQAIEKVVEYCRDQEGIRLSDLAIRYAFTNWINKGPTVIGVSKVEELERILENMLLIKGDELNNEDERIVRHIQQEILQDHFNETWDSGIAHPEFTDI
ncbi:hypothetical protein KAFR_0A02340 [Kazachstania africana CBS 2517]|uniref:NADP-dependent oxidoreductase domain-containing protein n=1 Tax=Kazachstania africana (strain ATCC 22294 / BCRC 22015 / CBS 2517 / CECT 1963 / NBRC 1671 / NRRL Y-8276) TaxID=1071382 RepID=H2AMS2_KAZAF|nr:hypothetical protein KAFR_0A02340 [Kazachstania africana CBS 2517]CCF55672.1 hypothetical protein KAFR_0A02340 [Kazachstania africana CBS 2517]